MRAIKSYVRYITASLSIFLISSCMHRVWYYGDPSTQVKLTPKWSTGAWLETSDLSQDTCNTKFSLSMSVGSKNYQPDKIGIDSLVIFDSADSLETTQLYAWHSSGMVTGLLEYLVLHCPRPQRVIVRGYYTLTPEAGDPERIQHDFELPFKSQLRGGGG